MEVNMIAFSRALGFLRKECKLTQAQLTDILHLPKGFVSRMECYYWSHNSRPVKPDVADKIAMLFMERTNYDVEKLFNDDIALRDVIIEKFGSLSPYVLSSYGFCNEEYYNILCVKCPFNDDCVRAERLKENYKKRMDFYRKCFLINAEDY